MYTIYKYKIEEDKENENFYIEVPKGAEVISAVGIEPADGLVGMKGFIYAIVDNEESKKVRREVIWYGTGWPIDYAKVGSSRYQFLGTFKQDPPHFTPMFWHIWVEQEQTELSEIFSKLLC